MAGHLQLSPLLAVGLLIAILLVPCEADCPNLCSGNGDCNSPDTRCHCHLSAEHQGLSYAGADCSLRECPKGRAWVDEATATDVAHAEEVMCSNKGTCDLTTGVCTCQAGYEGLACHRREFSWGRKHASGRSSISSERRATSRSLSLLLKRVVEISWLALEQARS